MWTTSIGSSLEATPLLSGTWTVGLDVVLYIEQHCATFRPGIPERPRDLLKSYIAKGWLGRKAGHGFYDDYNKS
jgi:3-hydroxyacyl-CoA dehydrogenase